jgi:anti-anti-sigma regulatory factor
VNPQVRISQTRVEQALILRISGSLNDAGDEIDSLLNAVAAAPEPAVVVLDLRDLPVVTPHGVRALHVVANSLSRRGVGCELVLGPGSAALESIRLTGLLELLPVSETPEQALAAGAGRRVATETQWTGENTDAEIDAVAASFAELTRTLLGTDSVTGVLRHVVLATRELVPGADLVSVTLRSATGELSSPASTEPAGAELDQAQYRDAAGPCVEAAWPAGPAYATSGDLAVEQRWPLFVKAAEARGFRSVLAIDLFPTGAVPNRMGALSVYSRQRFGLSGHDRRIALLLATHASLALARGDEVEAEQRQQAALRRALDTRDVIGQAKGILMARQGYTADQAFEVLRGMSQGLNVKLVDLARNLTKRQAELSKEA